MQGRDRFWWYWLIVAALGVATFGAVLVVIPALGRQVFGLLLFSSPSGIEALGASATPYITLVHGVLGAVMVGWAITLLSIAIGPLGRGSWDGWLAIAVSLSEWFVADTAFSLWTGFWPNAALNLVVATLFAIPLASTYRPFRKRRT